MVEDEEVGMGEDGEARAGVLQSVTCITVNNCQDTLCTC